MLSTLKLTLSFSNRYFTAKSWQLNQLKADDSILCVGESLLSFCFICRLQNIIDCNTTWFKQLSKPVWPPWNWCVKFYERDRGWSGVRENGESWKKNPDSVQHTVDTTPYAGWFEHHRGGPRSSQISCGGEPVISLLLIDRRV